MHCLDHELHVPFFLLLPFEPSFLPSTAFIIAFCLFLTFKLLLLFKLLLKSLQEHSPTFPLYFATLYSYYSYMVLACMCPSHYIATIKPQPIMLKILPSYYAFEQCSKKLPIMLNIMPTITSHSSYT